MKPSRVDWRSLATAVRARLPMTIALMGVAAVWALGAWWSFTEQRDFAHAKGFDVPALLPLVIDGFAVATACVAFAASLDGRPAVPARLGTAIAVAASAVSNGWWAAERSTHGGPVDLATVVMGVCVPVFANIAFEVLLAELRRQVQRARGLPAPAAVPTLRIVRLILAPVDTFAAWRQVVLNVTALGPIPPVPDPVAVPETVPPSREEPEEPQDNAEEAEEEPGGDHQQTEPPPPAKTGHKMHDARMWFRHEKAQGRTPSLLEVNDWIDSEAYIKGRHTKAWTDELKAEAAQDTGPVLRAVGE